jgi:hypothetical protein
MHKDALKLFRAFISRHLCYSLIPVTESHLIEVLMLFFAINKHLQTPLLSILCPCDSLDSGPENNFLKHVEVTRIILEVLLELGLRQMMRVL